MSCQTQFEQATLTEFHSLVLERGQMLYRNLPWRQTHNPYEIWISEVMLQQTQVSRVDGRWQRWLERFPTVDALASASPADVLEEWQGLGYNRRALALLSAAQELSFRGGDLPKDVDTLVKLPGIGIATAAGIRAFAFNLPSVYIETNVRTVFLHELYPTAEQVPDSELAAVAEQCCPKDASNPQDDPRTWYYALLDYGAYLKKVTPNPSRRSSTYAKQSRFEGSKRQKRATLVRLLLSHREGLSSSQLFDELNAIELSAGRPAVDKYLVDELLNTLSREGFCKQIDDVWCV